MKISWATDELFQIPDDILRQEGNEGNLALHAKYQEYYDSEQLQEKHVLRGSILTCSRGSASSRLDMPSDHGIDPAIALTSDCVINANIHTFGTCSCRADLDDSQCRPNLNNGWLQGEEATVKIWNEITQKYEATVKESALLPCFMGGMISIAEVFQRESAEASKILFCMHGKKFALVDTLHPMADVVLGESIVLADIEDMIVPASMFSVYGGTDDTNRDKAVEVIKGAGEEGRAAGTALEIVGEEDSVNRQTIAVGYAVDGTTGLRKVGVIPEQNGLIDLVDKYLAAGGDFAGACLGAIWALGLAPDAPQEVIDSLREQNVLKSDEIIGELVFETIDWFALLLGNMNNKIKLKDYMQANPILLGKVGDVVIPMGDKLEKGKSRKIENMNFSMIIENGEGYTGYEFLHGTDMTVGGFQIDGTVKKNQSGDVTYDLIYTWNDIMNPEIETYKSDRDKNDIATAYFNPKDYVIRIKWKDKSVRKANAGILNHHSGWLKDWKSNWVEKLSDAYGKRYDMSEDEQIRWGALAWPDRLQQIKNEYADYYN